MKTAAEIKNFIAQCYGTDKPYIRHWAGSMVFTDSIKWIREAADCFWLIDVIASYQKKLARAKEEFQVWKLTVDSEKQAVVTCEDGNGNELVKQEIGYTDFPLDELTLWCEIGGYGSAENWTSCMVLMVPSER
jgi:hypothetical protein